jgi:D-cysteine desulfhydrase
MSDYLATAYPRLAERLPKLALADLPTPLEAGTLVTSSGQHKVLIKRDDLTGKLYGGNKVRKLEYLLCRAKRGNAKRVATFGAIASNHALATALYTKSLGLKCTCFLLHQTCTGNVPRVLNMHLQTGTELVPYGGNRAQRVRTMREHLWHRHAWVIPMGGSSWLGALGFVNAGLELADQLASGDIDPPDRLYVANGTMGTAAGIALGLALAGLPTNVLAVQVTEDFVSNPAALRRLLAKTAMLLRYYDDSFPADLAERAHCTFRSDFLGAGYAKSNAPTDRAVEIAREELGLTLESTYTGKAMAAMLHDLDQQQWAGQSVLFWNTYNSRPLEAGCERPDNASRLPVEFLRYFD